MRERLASPSGQFAAAANRTGRGAHGAVPARKWTSSNANGQEGGSPSHLEDSSAIWEHVPGTGSRKPGHDEAGQLTPDWDVAQKRSKSSASRTDRATPRPASKKNSRAHTVPKRSLYEKSRGDDSFVAQRIAKLREENGSAALDWFKDSRSQLRGEVMARRRAEPGFSMTRRTSSRCSRTPPVDVTPVTAHQMAWDSRLESGHRYAREHLDNTLFLTSGSACAIESDL